MGTVSTALSFSPISSHTMMERHFIMNPPFAFSNMEDNDEDERVKGALVSSKAGPYQLDCISESLDDEHICPYRLCQNIAGLQI